MTIFNFQLKSTLEVVRSHHHQKTLTLRWLSPRFLGSFLKSSGSRFMFIGWSCCCCCWWRWLSVVTTTAVGLLATEVVVATLEAAEDVDDDDVDDGCEPSNKPCISFCDRPDTSRGVVWPFNLLFEVGAL